MRRLLLCRNETGNVILGDRIQKADNYFLRLVGLLSRKGLEPGEGLWILPCREIHSIGMRFAFDALFLDRELRVVHAIERMKPFRVSRLVPKARSVLELDAGVIAASGTRIGHRLVFEPRL